MAGRAIDEFIESEMLVSETSTSKPSDRTTLTKRSSLFLFEVPAAAAKMRTL